MVSVLDNAWMVVCVSRLHCFFLVRRLSVFCSLSFSHILVRMRDCCMGCPALLDGFTVQYLYCIFVYNILISRRNLVFHIFQSKMASQVCSSYVPCCLLVQNHAKFTDKSFKFYFFYFRSLFFQTFFEKSYFNQKFNFQIIFVVQKNFSCIFFLNPNFFTGW